MEQDNGVPASSCVVLSNALLSTPHRDGLFAPPVGTCLFVGCGVGKTSITRVAGALIPFFIAMIVALLLVSYIPWFSMFLPEAIGLVN